MLRASSRRSTELGLPPPAAFVGNWFDSAAVVVPSVDLRQVPADRVFSPAGLPRIGFRGFPDTVVGDRPLLPAAVAGSADGMLTLDHHGTWTAHGAAPDPAGLLARWAAPGTDRRASVTATHRPRWTTPDRAAHRRAVHDCLEAIAAGEIYQCCLSTRLCGELTADPLETFLGIARRAPAARSAYLTGTWGSVLSFSPEDYLVRAGDVVYSSPIKGTVAADVEPARLLDSAKDVAENIMIVDLVRHDLGGVAEIGSVQVTELLAVRPAPGVHHLVSTVRARTAVGHDALVEATFPPASVTGTPKLRARRLLAGWEPRSRGLHCGTIGMAVGDRLEASVAIRTLEVAPDGTVELGVGGGITADSEAEAEWAECLHKAAFSWGGGPPPSHWTT